jgi:hypothetical protein
MVLFGCARMLRRRIEEGKPFTRGQVLGNEIEKERALAGAGLPDDVEVAAAFLGVARVFVAVAVRGLASMYPASDWSILSKRCSRPVV